MSSPEACVLWGAAGCCQLGKARAPSCHCPGLAAGLWFPFLPLPSEHMRLIWKLARNFVCLHCVVVSPVEYADGSTGCIWGMWPLSSVCGCVCVCV